MAKVIFSMTAGVPHGDDYTQPTGDTPISLGEVEGKSYFSIDDGNTTIKTDGATDSVYGVSVVSDADEQAKFVKDGLEDLDRKFMEDKSMVDLLADVADDTSATKTAIADHKAAKAAFLSNLGF